ncbi:MAG: hypothetical protein ACYC4P_11555 [Thermoanaerobaculia bacterium]
MRQTPTPKTTATLTLDEHQTRTVALLARRLGGTTDEVIEFLATLGLFTLGLDEVAYGRVDDGVDRIFDGPGGELANSTMASLGDIECNLRNKAAEFFGKLTRPRMTGDWRGEPKAEQAEA